MDKPLTLVLQPKDAAVVFHPNGTVEGWAPPSSPDVEIPRGGPAWRAMMTSIFWSGDSRLADVHKEFERIVETGA